MHRGIGGTVFEPEQPERRDREVTLGPFTLMLIGCVLVALCGVCFLLGIAVGHRNAESSTAISVPPATAPAYTAPGNAQSKPSARQGGAQAPVAPTDSTDAAAVDSGAAGTTAEPDAPSESAVHPVIASQAGAQPSSGATVQPALAQSASIMVQIAAVEHSEDAEVLVGALRKHGYAVAARRDPSDGLLHVQVGPFANRSDAYAMRQKLLNDGYNAIVQP